MINLMFLPFKKLINKIRIKKQKKQEIKLLKKYNDEVNEQCHRSMW